MGGLYLNPFEFFFSLGNLLKPMGKPGNTWGHRKYSALKTPVSLRFYIFFGIGNLRYRQLVDPRPSNQKIAEIYLILNIYEIYALQGLPMITLVKSIPAIFQK